MELNVYDRLKNAFFNKDHEGYIKTFEEYLEEGYGVNEMQINNYIHALVAVKKYDKAYRIVRILEKYMEKNNSYEEIARLYMRCLKPKEAERVVNLKKTPIQDYNLLMEIKQLEGQYEEAYKILNSFPADSLIETEKERFERNKNKIINHIEKGAFIETEYTCFKENGNKLEPGHIVFLKNSPESHIKTEENIRLNNRPYMIWKFEEDKIYMFPVSSKVKEKSYRLYKQKYPNSIGDRTVRDQLCYTTEDNIVSVQDKVLEDDFKVILKYLYYLSYVSPEDNPKESKFVQTFVKKKANKYDIIVHVNPYTKDKSFYFVLDVENDNYKVVEMYMRNRQIIKTTPEIYKSSMIYDRIELNESEIKYLLNQLPQEILETLSDRKVDSYDIENYFYTPANISNEESKNNRGIIWKQTYNIEKVLKNQKNRWKSVFYML